MSAPHERLESIGLPERLDRRSRLGPFPSATDAIKFLVLAAFGALVALRFGVWCWPPFLGLGALIGLHRADAPAADERFVRWLRWRWRHTARPSARGSGRPTPSSGLARTSDGRLVGGLAAHGLPLAFRPAVDAQRIYRTFGQWLREMDGSILLHVRREPIPARTLEPSSSPLSGAAEERARSGYAELVRLLTRRRQRRRVDLILVAPVPGPAGAAGLERRLRGCADMLTALEIDHARLRRGELLRAIRELGPP